MVLLCFSVKTSSFVPKPVGFARCQFAFTEWDKHGLRNFASQCPQCCGFFCSVSVQKGTFLQTFSTSFSSFALCTLYFSFVKCSRTLENIIYSFGMNVIDLLRKTTKQLIFSSLYKLTTVIQFPHIFLDCISSLSLCYFGHCMIA